MKSRGLAVAAATLAGCVSQMPQTAEEFRKAIPGAFLSIEPFGPSGSHDVVYRAINGWATGESLGCPDLTKIG